MVAGSEVEVSPLFLLAAHCSEVDLSPRFVEVDGRRSAPLHLPCLLCFLLCLNVVEGAERHHEEHVLIIVVCLSQV